METIGQAYARRITTQIYIGRIRNKTKREYAEAWLKYITSEEDWPEEPSELSCKACYSVRQRIGEILGIRKR